MKEQKTLADWIGIGSAVLCLVHCLVAPFLFGAMAHAHTHSHAETDFWWLDHRWDYLFLALGLLAVWTSSRHTHSTNLRYALWGTYLLLAGAILLETHGEMLSYLVYAASFGLIVVHLLNIRKQLLPSALSTLE